MIALQWEEARESIRRELAANSSLPAEQVPLALTNGRILATDIYSDRPYPPFSRSMRDGFAVKSANLPGRLRIIGEVRAGAPSLSAIQQGESIEIMTGAPVPEGADAVLMVEHALRQNGEFDSSRSLGTGENISPAGCEAGAGERVLQAGTKIDYAGIGVLATVGVSQVSVFAKPRVAIIATGDELVDIDGRPESFQIRNSNSYSLAALTERAGGTIVLRTVAKDTRDALRSALDRALEADLILLSGGVSAGRYDLVEDVLAEYGAEFYFTRVKIQPGQPAVFGKVRGKFFFGLPGNPASTMVTFELFARYAIEILGGQSSPQLLLMQARLSTLFRHQTGLTRFLPATLSENGSVVTPVKWQGSGDVFALGRANAFLVAESSREQWQPGEFIQVLPR